MCHVFANVPRFAGYGRRTGTRRKNSRRIRAFLPLSTACRPGRRNFLCVLMPVLVLCVTGRGVVRKRLEARENRARRAWGDSATTMRRLRNHAPAIPEPRNRPLRRRGRAPRVGVNETTIENGTPFMGQRAAARGSGRGGEAGGVACARQGRRGRGRPWRRRAGAGDFFICDLPWIIAQGRHGEHGASALHARHPARPAHPALRAWARRRSRSRPRSRASPRSTTRTC